MESPQYGPIMEYPCLRSLPYNCDAKINFKAGRMGPTKRGSSPRAQHGYDTGTTGDNLGDSLGQDFKPWHSVLRDPGGLMVICEKISSKRPRCIHIHIHI